MSKKLILKISVMVCFVLMVAVNILANTLPIGDFNTGQISSVTPPYILLTVCAVSMAVILLQTVLIARRRQDA